jgi:hypothetical protein
MGGHFFACLPSILTYHRPLPLFILFIGAYLSGVRSIIAQFDISNTLLDDKSSFDYYLNSATFDSEAPQLLNALADLQRADPETRLIREICKEQKIMLSPAGV